MSLSGSVTVESVNGCRGGNGERWSGCGRTRETVDALFLVSSNSLGWWRRLLFLSVFGSLFCFCFQHRCFFSRPIWSLSFPFLVFYMYWNQLVTCVLYSNLVVLSPVYFWETVEGELFSLFGCHDWKRKKHARSMEELIHFDTHFMGWRNGQPWNISETCFCVIFLSQFLRTKHLGLEMKDYFERKATRDSHEVEFGELLFYYQQNIF